MRHGKYIITATEVLSWRWSRPARVIVGENVKCDLSKRDIYILDLDGKEHKLYLRQGVERTNALPNLASDAFGAS